jgi:hypothetical protein
MALQIVNVSIRPEQRDRSLDLVRANAAQTREGCESCEIGEDIEIPNRLFAIRAAKTLAGDLRCPIAAPTGPGAA